VLEAMRQREALRDIPVIVVTGQVLTEAEMARLSQGVATVLSKGLFSLDETLAHLDAALERPHRLSSEAQRLVRKAMAYVQQSYQEPLSRHDIARHVGMSDDYLTYCFRQELGMTPIAYLNRYRIAQAKRLLKESDGPITQIALDVGFSDSGYFSRVFRKEAGISPEVYRRGL
jgi:AraC-like DNA-binding protein